MDKEQTVTFTVSIFALALVIWMFVVPWFQSDSLTKRKNTNKVDFAQVSGTLNQVNTSYDSQTLQVSLVQDISREQEVTCNTINLIDANIYTPTVSSTGIEPFAENSTTRSVTGSFQYVDGLVSLHGMIVYPQDSGEIPSTSFSEQVTFTVSLPTEFPLDPSGLINDPRDTNKLVPFSSGISALWDADVTIDDHQLYLVQNDGVWQIEAVYTFSGSSEGYGAFRFHLAYPSTT